MRHLDFVILAALVVATIVIVGVFIMATIQQLTEALAAQKTAIDDLAARIAAKPVGGITEADLEPILTGIESNTAEVAAIV